MEETNDEKKVTELERSEAESDDSSEACDGVESGACDGVESVKCDPSDDGRDPFKLHLDRILTEEQVEQLANKNPPSYIVSEVSYLGNSYPDNTYPPQDRLLGTVEMACPLSGTETTSNVSTTSKTSFVSVIKLTPSLKGRPQ